MAKVTASPTGRPATSVPGGTNAAPATTAIAGHQGAQRDERGAGDDGDRRDQPGDALDVVRSPVSELDRLTKRYGAARGIAELSLTVSAGEVFVAPVDPREFASLPGPSAPVPDGRRITVEAAGDLHRVIKAAARHEVMPAVARA
jgi:hypothetical protein